jgi:hypothetical protein
MSTAPTTDRERLRQQWHEHADALFNRLFAPDPALPPPSFDLLEQRTRQLSTDLASWLLEQRVQLASDPSPEGPPLCPRCGRAGQPAPRPQEPRPKRVLRTRVGPIEFRRERWCCTTCRVVFFPRR